MSRSPRNVALLANIETRVAALTAGQPSRLRVGDQAGDRPLADWLLRLSPPADREVGERLQRLAPLARRGTAPARAWRRRRSRRRGSRVASSAPVPTTSSRARRKSASVCSLRPITRSQNSASRAPVRAMARISGSVALPSRKSSPAFLPSVSAEPGVVERVVGELEGEAEVLAVAAQRGGAARRQRRPTPRRPRPRRRTARRSSRR